MRKWKTGKVVVKEGKFIGAHVPMDLWHDLALQAAAHGLPKTDIIRAIMTEWHKELQARGRRDEILTLANKLQSKWRAYKMANYMHASNEEQAEAFNAWLEYQFKQLKNIGVGDDILKTLKNRVRQ